MVKLDRKFSESFCDTFSEMFLLPLCDTQVRNVLYLWNNSKKRSWIVLILAGLNMDPDLVLWRGLCWHLERGGWNTHIGWRGKQECLHMCIYIYIYLHVMNKYIRYTHNTYIYISIWCLHSCATLYAIFQTMFLVFDMTLNCSAVWRCSNHVTFHVSFRWKPALPKKHLMWCNYWSLNWTVRSIDQYLSSWAW